MDRGGDGEIEGGDRLEETGRWKGAREWLEGIVRHSGNRGINTNDKRHETRKQMS